VPLLTESSHTSLDLRGPLTCGNMKRVDAVFAIPVAMLVIGVLALVLRWAFGNDRRAVPDHTGDDFGLLVEVAVVPTETPAKILAARLRRSGIRATTTRGPDGRSCRVMVFPADVPSAKLLLSA
jgi:hypothetical protein